MDDEKQQNGLIQKTGDALKKGAKKQAKNLTKKIIKKVIMVITGFLLKIIAPIIIAVVIITAIADFIDGILGDETKKANAFAVKYTSGSISGGSSSGGGNSGGGTTVGSTSGGGNSNSAGEVTEESSLGSIVVNIDNVLENGAYKLTYEFRDENGNLYTEEQEDQVISNIKNDLLEENENLDLSKFSNSELKIIGALMYNGLPVDSYNEEELKALVIFLKADIASQSFDLRSGENTEVNIDELRKNDEVYGTIEIHKTTIETDANGNIVDDKEIKLKYVPYGDKITRRNFLLYGCTKR